ncbi:MAG TPA: LysE family translocator [Methylibium sp.]|uniref:LysE family translocator n=1 Tax=Methylibium sp. TaxID=2067992 RepID=UPI002DBFE13C|nr:LysE family translocator [Methylibium sp.]HEU4460814.1 LysE family translocator [Methylibium sp.]
MSQLAFMGLQDLPLFFVAVFVLNATPGADLLLTLTRTLQGGARAGLAAAAGISAGCLVHTLAAALGLAALLAVSALAFETLRWIGAAYLLWLAIGMLRRAWAGGDAAAAPEAAAPRSGWADFRAGLLTNVLNPKVALFFLAFLPQFIAADAPNKGLAFVLLGLIGIAQGAVFLVGVVAVATRLRRFGSARAARVLQAIGGALFAALALRLAAASRPGA